MAILASSLSAEMNETVASLVGLLSNSSALGDALDDSPIGGTPFAAVATAVTSSPPLALLMLLILGPALISLGTTLFCVCLAPLQVLCLPCILTYLRRHDEKLLGKVERSSEDPTFVTIELLPAAARSDRRPGLGVDCDS